MSLEMLNIGLDFVLIFAAIWMIFTVRGVGLGGVVGSTLTIIHRPYQVNGDSVADRITIGANP